MKSQPEVHSTQEQRDQVWFLDGIDQDVWKTGLRFHRKGHFFCQFTGLYFPADKHKSVRVDDSSVNYSVFRRYLHWNNKTRQYVWCTLDFDRRMYAKQRLKDLLEA